MESVNINTKEDFLVMLSGLIKELESNSTEWTNQTLITYFIAMQGWVEDMDGYYVNSNLPIPDKVTWNVFSDILGAAKIYE